MTAPYTQQAYPPQPPKRSSRWLWILGLALLVIMALAFAGCVALIASSNPSVTSVTQAPVTVNNGRGPQKFTEGQYVVGKDIAPGTYKTTGGDYCSWERLKAFDGEFDSIIANGIVNGPSQLTIKPTDKGVGFAGSCVWTRT